jgi:hypothetical protein
MNFAESLAMNRKIAALIETKYPNSPGWEHDYHPEARYYRMIRHEITMGEALLKHARKAGAKSG